MKGTLGMTMVVAAGMALTAAAQGQPSPKTPATPYDKGTTAAAGKATAKPDAKPAGGATVAPDEPSPPAAPPAPPAPPPAAPPAPPPAAPAPDASASAAPAMSWKELPPAAVASFAVGASFLVTGIVTGIVALRKASDIEERCQVQCYQSEIDANAPRAHLATASFVLATLGIGGGVAILMLHEPAAGDDKGKPSAKAAAVVAPGFLGLGGSF